MNYGIAIAPGMIFKPFLQFISHPDQATIPNPSGKNTRPLLIGALLDVDGTSLMGLPTLPH